MVLRCVLGVGAECVVVGLGCAGCWGGVFVRSTLRTCNIRREGAIVNLNVNNK